MALCYVIPSSFGRRLAQLEMLKPVYRNDGIDVPCSCRLGLALPERPETLLQMPEFTEDQLSSWMIYAILVTELRHGELRLIGVDVTHHFEVSDSKDMERRRSRFASLDMHVSEHTLLRGIAKGPSAQVHYKALACMEQGAQDERTTTMAMKLLSVIRLGSFCAPLAGLECYKALIDSISHLDVGDSKIPTPCTRALPLSASDWLNSQPDNEKKVTYHLRSLT